MAAKTDSISHDSHRRTILITAGPTHEPIDAVRFIGNRSSGRMGTALATEAARRGWNVTLLMGPAPVAPTDTDIRLVRFRTCADLQGLLREHVPHSDVLVMAAAVADYRPKVDPQFFGGKFRRKSENLTLELEPTPDLLAEVAKTRRPDQLMVGFALEPRAELLQSARDKLIRKQIDLVVGNPLETMDSESVEAIVLTKDGRETRTPAVMSKTAFAPWLMELIEAAWRDRSA
ncbi:Cysteine/Cysteine sulfinic acid decarboxylase [Phycisphaerales bacterium]|nr:Cysteine/Cysteine sulfinic acid decarboxylase [Phycisphaerales bacterium]